MQVKQLFTDDDAVSPVIGVILMVAITVILAAVIASFVLGLGNNATDQTPTASFVFEYEQVDTNSGGNTYGLVTVSHDGGDTLNDQELYIRGSGFNGSTLGSSAPGSGTYPGPGNRLYDYVREQTGAKLDRSEGPGLWNGSKSGQDSAIVSGDFTEIYVQSDYDLSVNYESQEGQASATLQSDTGPDA